MTVIISKKAYQTVVAACVRFANTKIPQEEWVEASGIFVGRNEGDNVVVTAAYPIMHETFDPEAVIDKYVWSDEDYMHIEIINEVAFNNNEFVVGWWHSHPGFLIMLSGFGDRKTTASYQGPNPLAIALVFDPVRLNRQIEFPSQKGGPIKQLKGDPGFKIFRLADGFEPKSNLVEIDYIIEGYENPDQMVQLTQKFVIHLTNFFPKDDIEGVYTKFVESKITELDSKVMGTEEYLATLARKGEGHRIPEVLETQTQDIRKFIAETFLKIENIKEFMDYLEYKERETIIPLVQEILSRWDEKIATMDAKLKEYAKKAKKPKKFLK